MKRSNSHRSLLTLLGVIGLASVVAAQDAASSTHPSRAAQGDDQTLIATIEFPGVSTRINGLFRVRPGEGGIEVLRAHDSPGAPAYPSVWFPVTGDGAFVGAQDGVLWRLDPTGPERTIELPGIRFSGGAGGIGQARGVVVFGAATASGAPQLWRTDGTPDGTWALADLLAEGGVTVGSVVMFPATTASLGRELWRTDGTAEGTVLVADLVPGPDSAGLQPIGALDGELLFSRWDVSGATSLWLTDGSREGTRVLLEDAPFVYDRGHRFGDVVVFEARTWGAALDGVWRSDGSVEGTYRLSPDAPSDRLVVEGDRLWFRVGVDEALRGVWTSDGTRAGTRRVWGPPEIDPTAYVVDIVPLGDGVVFRAWTGAERASLWFSDGTQEGTSLLLPDAVEIGSLLPNTYYFGMLASTGDTAWFAARAGSVTDLWRTDGTVEGTRPSPLGGLAASQLPAPGPLLPFLDAGPVGSEPAPPTVIAPPVRLPLGVRRLRIDIRLGGFVDLRLRGDVPLGGTKDVEDETLTVDVGGILTAVALDRRGRARTTDGRRVRARVRTGRGGDPDRLRVDLRLRRAPVGSQLLDESLSVPAGEPHVDRPIDVEFVWRDALHTAESTVRYRQRKNRGTATLLD